MGPTAGVKEVERIMTHIQSLSYVDAPDYREVIHQLLSIYNNYDMVQRPMVGNNYVWRLVRKK